MSEKNLLLEIFETKEEKTLLSLLSDKKVGNSIHSTIIAVDNYTTDNNLLDTVESCINEPVRQLFKFESHILIETQSNESYFLGEVALVSANEVMNVENHAITVELEPNEEF